MIEILEKLQTSELFRGVETNDLQALVDVMRRATYPTGAVLFNEGDEGDKMYEIIAGSIRIYTTDSHGNEITLVIRKAGEIVGELALLDRQPRSASAMANEPLDVLILDRATFLEFLKDRPTVGLQMMRTLTGRIRYTTTYLQKLMELINRLGQGDYQKVMEELTSEEADSEMQKLITAFLEMVRSVQDREANLQEELKQLRDS